MDTRRFDNWTRSRAATRRTTLGVSLGAGLAAMIGRVSPATAQFDGGGSCTYAITLTPSGSDDSTVAGTLSITIGAHGAIDSGALTLNGQPAASVTGQATGSALDLAVKLSDGSLLTLSGVASGDVTSCATRITGILANPTSGQLGTWDAQPGATAVDVPPSPTSVPVSGQQPVAPTPTPTPPDGRCIEPKMLCGSNCCPAGSTCLDSNTGACECPAGTEECDIACFPSCADGHALDPVTCLCPTG